MKNMSSLLLAGLIAGWFAFTAPAAPQDAAPQPPGQTAQPANQDTNAPPAATPAANPANAPAPNQTNAAPAVPLAGNTNAELSSGTADQGLTLNMRGVSVDRALAFLSESAGFTINRQTSTRVDGTVDLVSEKPLSMEEIIPLFNKVLADHNLTAIQDHKTLTIMTLDDAASNAGIPVNVLKGPADDVPQDSQFVTEIIPVHSLNPTQAVKDLYTLIPPGARMNSNEAGNAIIMTARQADIRRFAQIIAAIDSTGNGDLQVFLLRYADSKAIASELKDVFTSQDATPGVNPFAIFGRRGGAGGGGAGGGADESSKRATVHVNAVSDDQNNAVLVSAPADFMPGISNIIDKLDIPQEDTVKIELFALHNADCTDVANELLALFPDPNLQSQNQTGGRRGAAQFGGGGFGFGRGNAASSAAGMSDRLKKQVTVNAVPDPRTQSVLVTASNDTMTQIRRMIDELDSNPAGHMNVYVFQPTFADVLDLQGPLQDLFMATGKTSSSTTQQNALLMRMQSGAQAMSSSMSSSSTLSGAMSTTGSGGTSGLR